MNILFHGTTKENAALIMENGFRPYTYFALHLEDALAFGGDYIFEVLFEESPGEYWEHIISKPIKPERIKALYFLSPSIMYENESLNIELKKKNILEQYDDGVKICNNCSGRGQMESYPMFHRWRDIDKITACPICRGFGAVVIKGSSDIHEHRK